MHPSNTDRHSTCSLVLFDSEDSISVHSSLVGTHAGEGDLLIDSFLAMAVEAVNIVAVRKRFQEPDLHLECCYPTELFH